VHRPYVFVFFAFYLLAAVPKMGWVRTGAFTLLAFSIAFVAEFSSTRTGFPFGIYRYIDATRTHELWLSNVPVWDSLSFSFLCYLGFQLAVILYSPLERRRGDLQVLDTMAIRTSPRVLVTGACLMAIVDVVIDPLTVRGERWFLGKVYEYPEGGLYFGVPLSNFAGWLFVGLLTIGAYQRIEPYLLTPTRFLRAGQMHLPLGGLLEPALYLGIVLFNLTLTFWIGEPLLGTIGCFIFAPLVLVYLTHLIGDTSRAGPLAREAHRRDFPRARTLA
jgi:putative membrane protein